MSAHPLGDVGCGLLVFLIALGLGVAGVVGLSISPGATEPVAQEVNLDLASGKATYMGGAACIIATTTEQTPIDIIRYARACAAAHEAWLTKEQP